MEQQLNKIIQGLGIKNFRYNENGWSQFSCPLAPFKKEHGFKEDRHPSAGIVQHEDTYIWNCFCCKSKGNINQLIDQLSTLRKRDYSHLKYLCDEVFIPDFDEIGNYDMLEPFDEELAELLFEPMDKYAKAYVSSRGVSDDTCSKLGLLYDPEYRRIVFPVRDRKGTLYGFTARSIDSEPKIFNYADVPISKFVLGSHLWKNGRPTIIVEGLFSYARLHEISKHKQFPFNIGALMGSSMSKDQAQILINQGNDPVYFLLDDDPAGQAGTKKAYDKLKDQLPVFILKYPEGKNDPADLTSDELYSMVRSPLKISVKKGKQND